MAIFHFKTIHQILICGKIFSKWESNVSQNCNLCNKEDDISHMLFTCVMVRNVWKGVSNILQCELKLEHIILYHNENHHSNKGVNPGGDEGDISPPPCFDMGG